MTKTPKFTKDTIPFLTKAGKQKRLEWLDQNQAEYERVLKDPFVALAKELKARVLPRARGYHFPTQGIGRIKRPAFKVEDGQALYKNWLSIIASRPTGSRFENNPHLFFGILPHEPEWRGVVVAGGLYRPSSRQLKNVRQALAKDASAFHDLFEDSDFRARFKTQFSMTETATRVPNGFDAEHPEMEWIKLKRFVVFKKLPASLFTSAKLIDSVEKDFLQLLRLNDLLEKAIASW